MKKNIYSLVFLLFCCCFSYAQVGVGTTSPKAALDVESSTNGILIPRVALTSTTISTPVVNPNGGTIETSTLVYNTNAVGDVLPGFYYWDGTKWIAMKGLGDQPTTNQPNIYSVKGTTDIQTNSSNFVDMQGMSITFTPTKSRVYVTLSVAGEISSSYIGQIYGQIALLVNNTAVGGTKFVATDFDEDYYGDVSVFAGWNAQMAMFPVDVTPGVSTTIKAQWNRGASSYYSSSSSGYITNPANSKKAISHRSLTVFE